jgi:hypothetical protein
VRGRFNRTSLKREDKDDSAGGLDGQRQQRASGGAGGVARRRIRAGVGASLELGGERREVRLGGNAQRPSRERTRREHVHRVDDALRYPVLHAPVSPACVTGSKYIR